MLQLLGKLITFRFSTPIPLLNLKAGSFLYSEGNARVSNGKDDTVP